MTSSKRRVRTCQSFSPRRRPLGMAAASACGRASAPADGLAAEPTPTGCRAGGASCTATGVAIAAGARENDSRLPRLAAGTGLLASKACPSTCPWRPSLRVLATSTAMRTATASTMTKKRISSSMPTHTLSTADGMRVTPSAVCCRHCLIPDGPRRSALRTAGHRPGSATNMEPLPQGLARA